MKESRLILEGFLEELPEKSPGIFFSAGIVLDIPLGIFAEILSEIAPKKLGEIS